MKTNEDRQLENLINNVMKSTALDTPSLDFTSIVMSKVSASKTKVYKPLIPKSVFLFLIGCFSALLIYAYFNQPSLKDSSVDFSLAFIKHFKFSTVTIYSLVIGTIMLFVQIAFLKNHFNKQFGK
jgi:hypothetical protein